MGDEIKLFHAVSLMDVGQGAGCCRCGCAKIGPEMAEMRKAAPGLTAVVEDRLEDRQRELCGYGAGLHEGRERIRWRG